MNLFSNLEEHINRIGIEFGEKFYRQGEIAGVRKANEEILELKKEIENWENSALELIKEQAEILVKLEKAERTLNIIELRAMTDRWRGDPDDVQGYYKDAMECADELTALLEKQDG